ncbi:hypothetical protein L226DRAFT_122089 [Lentinus tigrinus ALCF2SS1-7]|uniref:uncharacterized protein n=1 Tax=Lentinus tigrinus ALCF2SS1-7 TaxID=1328758 RepID=UPI001165E9CF|nr:hypothetical protein L226DRAFT_122089 [Lentinus tigrinus ALCF2SS1-7]
MIACLLVLPPALRIQVDVCRLASRISPTAMRSRSKTTNHQHEASMGSWPYTLRSCAVVGVHGMSGALHFPHEPVSGGRRQLQNRQQSGKPSGHADIRVGLLGKRHDPTCFAPHPHKVSALVLDLHVAMLVLLEARVRIVVQQTIFAIRGAHREQMSYVPAQLKCICRSLDSQTSTRCDRPGARCIHVPMHSAGPHNAIIVLRVARAHVYYVPAASHNHTLVAHM